MQNARAKVLWPIQIIAGKIGAFFLSTSFSNALKSYNANVNFGFITANSTDALTMAKAVSTNTNSNVAPALCGIKTFKDATMHHK